MRNHFSNYECRWETPPLACRISACVRLLSVCDQTIPTATDTWKRERKQIVQEQPHPRMKGHLFWLLTARGCMRQNPKMFYGHDCGAHPHTPGLRSWPMVT